MASYTLTKEQAALLRSLGTASSNEEAAKDTEVRYTNDDLFNWKKKNQKSTAAQNYLLVSEFIQIGLVVKGVVTLKFRSKNNLCGKKNKAISNFSTEEEELYKRRYYEEGYDLYDPQ